MDRPGRRHIRLHPEVYAEEGRAFSIVIGTSPRRPVFADLALGRASVAVLSGLAARTGNAVYVYCFMPDHVHLLLGARRLSPIPTFVGAFKSLCQRENRRLRDGSPLWQRSFWDHAMRTSEDLAKAGRYILENPVRRGLVRRWEDYPLSGSLVWDLGPHAGAVGGASPAPTSFAGTTDPPSSL
ncbi:MAG: transposase [Thermoanaerobaculaceae bacterium]